MKNADDQIKPSSTVESSPEQLPLDHDTVSNLHSPLLGHASRVPTRTPSGLRRNSNDHVKANGSTSQQRGLRDAFASIAGLVIHAAADGIAMGASAGSGDESLKLIVLFAIMIHKAVSTFLVSHNDNGCLTMQSSSSRQHLVFVLCLWVSDYRKEISTRQSLSLACRHQSERFLVSDVTKS